MITNIQLSAKRTGTIRNNNETTNEPTLAEMDATELVRLEEMASEAIAIQLAIEKRNAEIEDALIELANEKLAVA